MMLRLIRKIGTFYMVWIAVLLIQIPVSEIGSWMRVIHEMDQMIARGNSYAVLQTQDIDIVSGQILNNVGSHSAYNRWLTAMSSYSGLKGLYATDYHSGVSSTVSAYGSDTVLTKNVIPFLKRDFYEGTNGNGYTPLNFGITYLDPVLMQKDMERYLKHEVSKTGKAFRWGQYGKYRVDPRTIAIDVSLDVEPSVLNVSDKESQYEFMKLYGLSSGQDILDKSDIKTIVKYKITYKIKYDYIPNTKLLNLRRSEVTQYMSQNTPPDNIYFPCWYDADGNVNPPELRIKGARYKITMAEPLTYSFDYVLTH